MKNFRFILVLLVVISIFFLASCKKEPHRPFSGGLPNKDIVFVPEENPTYINADISTLGFIDDDGSGREEYSFLFAGGAKSMFGKTMFTQYAVHPNWSTSGDELVFGIRNTAPNIRLIDLQGYMYGKDCDLIGDTTTFDKNGYLIKVLNKFDRIFEQYQSLIDENHVAIVHFDVKKCNVVSVDSIAIPSDNVFGISDETINGQFTISYYETGTEYRRFLIYEPMEENYQVVPGFFPEFNDDGTLLAYYSAEGMLVVKDLKTGEESNLTEVTSYSYLSFLYDMATPSWSPNSQWLVYSTVDGNIYKIDIATKEKIYLTHGWSPDWR